ncbi:MAG: branched-chain amino acid ABC transporter permease [Candidatus Caldarchaeum sp.]|nr:branched-chain amino acid ABC transporter permease [Candidatus Caldarchaeum sp.]MDW8360236.1 branched-chain amino acid ABC transporter permease [Candidatus Caldarchaeum sp.]
MPTPLAVVELTLAGLLLGGIYSLLSVGLTVTFGVARVLNLTHGEFMMVSSLAVYLLFQFTGGAFNPFATLGLLIPILFASGYLFEKFLIRPLRQKPVDVIEWAPLLVTLGVALIIEDIAFMTVPREFGVSYSLPPTRIMGLTLSTTRLASLVLVTCVALALHIFLRRTFIGKAIRATIQDREGALTMGINVNRVSAITFGLGVSLAAAAGVFLVMIRSVDAYVGLPITAKAVAIVILGGMGSILGSLLGAIVLGISEVYVSFYSPAWSFTVAWIILIIILLLRPQGILGKRAERV